MLTGLLPAYVDRFARAWHRLSTTDTSELPIHYRESKPDRQVRKYYFFIQVCARRYPLGLVPIMLRNTLPK